MASTRRESERLAIIGTVVSQEGRDVVQLEDHAFSRGSSYAHVVGCVRLNLDPILKGNCGAGGLLDQQSVSNFRRALRRRTDQNKESS